MEENRVAHGLVKIAVNNPDKIWIEENPLIVTDCIFSDLVFLVNKISLFQAKKMFVSEK